MLNMFESFSRIHKTCIDFCIIPHEVVDGLDCIQGAQDGGAAWLQKESLYYQLFDSDLVN